MQYRLFGKTGEKVSVLGFGAMRLPVIDNKQNEIAEDQATKLIRFAIDNGVNYIDTAYPYHGDGLGGPGESEPFIAKVLADGYREKVKLATKLPTWLVTSREQMDQLLAAQLERLNTDYIDFYLIHALEKNMWANVVDLGIFDFMDKAVESGKVKHIGFSFHDDIDTFKKIVDAYSWEFCQIQYNYLDTKYQAGEEGLEYAAAKGLGIAIMEPLRGGALINNIPLEAEKLMREYDNEKSNVEWALEWLFDREEISLVLSGMTLMEHVKDNLQISDRAKAGAMSVQQHEIMAKVQQLFRDKQKVDCTACRYCMPCPQGVDIPENFALYNTAHLLGDFAHCKLFYSVMESRNASLCVKCGKCMTHCPQGINIITELDNVNNYFTVE